MIKPCRSGFRLKQSQYTLKKDVKLFGDLISQLDVQHSIHISIIVDSLTKSVSISYQVHQYLSTELLGLEEYPEDKLDPDGA
jgi:hypothetical protein